MSLYKKIKNSKKMSMKNLRLIDAETSYIDTGLVNINAILSGNFKKGLPTGKVIFFVGESQSGKSLLAKNIVKKLILKDNYTAIWYDTEGAIEDSQKEIFDHGIQEENFIIPDLPVDVEINAWTVENYAKSMMEYLDLIIEERAKGSKEKFVFVLDSLNVLPTNKEFDNASRKDAVGDVGSKAKVIQARFKPIHQKLSQIEDVIFIGINHTYDNPNNPYSLLPEISSGNFMKYIAQRIIYVRSKDEKNDDKKGSARMKFNGITVRLFNYKNRRIKKGSSVELSIDYNKGIHPYADILPLMPDVYESKTDNGTQWYYHWYKLYTKDEIVDMIKNTFEVTDVTVNDNGTYTISTTKTKANANTYYTAEEVGDKLFALKPVKKLLMKKEIYQNTSTYFSNEMLDRLNPFVESYLTFGNDSFSDGSESTEAEYDEDSIDDMFEDDIDVDEE